MAGALTADLRDAVIVLAMEIYYNIIGGQSQLKKNIGKGKSKRKSIRSAKFIFAFHQSVLNALDSQIFHVYLLRKIVLYLVLAFNKLIQLQATFCLHLAFALSLVAFFAGFSIFGDLSIKGH